MGGSGSAYRIQENAGGRSTDDAAEVPWLAGKSTGSAIMSAGPLEEGSKRKGAMSSVVVGHGKWGEVVVCQNSVDHLFYAVKRISRREVYKGKCAERLQQEIDILASADHHFVAKWFGGYLTQCAICLVMEYAVGGELFTRMHRRERFSEAETKFYAAEIACVLHYLHDRLNVVFRDLKPENLLIGADGHIRLVDFGFATPLTSEEAIVHDSCGTAMYVAPELVSNNATGRAHGFPVDWWSAGCIFFEMLTGSPPFGDTESMSKFEVFNNIHKRTVRFPASTSLPCLPGKISAEAKALTLGLLHKDASKRFGWSQVESHAWFSDINWTTVSRAGLTPPWVPASGSLQEGDHSNFIDWDKRGDGSVPDAKCEAYTRLAFPHGAETKTPAASGRGGSRRMSDSGLGGPRQPQNVISRRNSSGSFRGRVGTDSATAVPPGAGNRRANSLRGGGGAAGMKQRGRGGSGAIHPI